MPRYRRSYASNVYPNHLPRTFFSFFETLVIRRTEFATTCCAFSTFCRPVTRTILCLVDRVSCINSSQWSVRKLLGNNDHVAERSTSTWPRREWYHRRRFGRDKHRFAERSPERSRRLKTRTFRESFLSAKERRKEKRRTLRRKLFFYRLSGYKSKRYESCDIAERR